MSPTIVTIFGLIIWMLILVGGLGVYRTFVSATTGRAANQFSPTGEDVSAFSARLCRAHANCYEFVPFALAALVFAVATNGTGITDGLALIFLAARIAQSTIHVLSTSVPAVLLRFVAFLVQIVILAYWSIRFLTIGLGA